MPSAGRPPRERAAVVAAAVSLGLTAVKAAGWALTGSSALLASAADSATDVVMSALNALTIRMAGAPPDAGHPFGHGKYENLGALVQATLLFAVGGGVLVKSFSSGVVDEAMRQPVIGVAVAFISLMVSLFLARFLAGESRRHQSPALAADAAHYKSDWIAGVGVLGALGAEFLWNWHAADHVVGALIAAAVLRIAWSTAADAVNGLLDVRLAADELRTIDSVVRARSPVVRGYHDLLTRRSGPVRFIQLHLEIDAALSFREAHCLVEAVVHDLESAFPDAMVTIHAEPSPSQAPAVEAAEPASARR